MSLKERILKKIEEQLREMLPLPEKVILGREEYEELLATPQLEVHISTRERRYLGLKVTLSRRKRYLCVVRKQTRAKRIPIRDGRGNTVYFKPEIHHFPEHLRD